MLLCLGDRGGRGQDVRATAVWLVLKRVACSYSCRIAIHAVRATRAAYGLCSCIMRLLVLLLRIVFLA